MSSSKNEKVNITLFGIAEGESISEKAYAADTLCYILEGEVSLPFNANKHVLKIGDCIAVPEEHFMQSKGRVHLKCCKSRFNLI